MTAQVDTQTGTTLELTCSQCYHAAVSVTFTREIMFGRTLQVATISPESQGAYIDGGKAFCAVCAEEVHQGYREFARLVARCG